jgi:hypothetical protein
MSVVPTSVPSFVGQIELHATVINPMEADASGDDTFSSARPTALELQLVTRILCHR